MDANIRKKQNYFKDQQNRKLLFFKKDVTGYSLFRSWLEAIIMKIAPASYIVKKNVKDTFLMPIKMMLSKLRTCHHDS